LHLHIVNPGVEFPWRNASYVLRYRLDGRFQE
jgi:hypothetical protein